MLGLTLRALDEGCDVLAFVRDRDGDADREQQLERGIEEAARTFASVRIVGGVARESIEAWILAMRGDAGCESHRHPKGELATRHGIRTRAEKVSVVDSADLDPARARSATLDRWVSRAQGT